MTVRLTVSTVLAIALLAAGSDFAVAGDAIDPKNFSATVDNPWLPLKPGTVLTYEGTKDDKPATLVMTVSSKTKVPSMFVRTNARGP